MITVNAAWYFVLTPSANDGSLMPVGQRTPYSAGLPLGVAAPSIARRLAEEVPVATGMITSALEAAGQEKATALMALEDEDEDEDETDFDETRMAGTALLTERALQNEGLDFSVEYYSRPQPQLIVTIDGLPRFVMQPQAGVWWFYYSADAIDVVETERINTLDSQVPHDVDPATLAVLICYFVAKDFIGDSAKAGALPGGIGAQVQAALYQSIRFLVQAKEGDNMAALFARVAYEELTETK